MDIPTAALVYDDDLPCDVFPVGFQPAEINPGTQSVDHDFVATRSAIPPIDLTDQPAADVIDKYLHFRATVKSYVQNRFPRRIGNE